MSSESIKQYLTLQTTQSTCSKCIQRHQPSPTSKAGPLFRARRYNQHRTLQTTPPTHSKRARVCVCVCTPTYANRGTTGLFVTANASHPPTSASPPIGVTGPAYRPNLCGSSTSRYRLPENMVMPAVNKPMATALCGAATDAKVRTAEWTSWYCAAVPQFAAGGVGWSMGVLGW